MDFSQLKVKQEDEYSEKKLKLGSETKSYKIKSGNTLLCFDFDKTMVQGSLHRALSDAFVPSAKHLEQFLTNKTENEQNKELLIKASNLRPHVDRFLADETKSWKNKEQLVKLLEEALKAECHIAIVSFGSYPDAIKYALTKLVGQSQAEKILVKSYPLSKDEMFSVGKQKHIEEAMDYFGVYDTENVVLMDDDFNNVEIALKNWMHAIHVGKDGAEYLYLAFKLLEEVQTQKADNQPSECTVKIV